MPQVEIPYQHTVQALTAGQIRAALEGVPDDAVIEVSTVDDPTSLPGHPGEADRLVITSAGFEADWVPPARGERDGHWVKPGTTFVLECDFPTGEYVRYRDQDDRDDYDRD